MTAPSPSLMFRRGQSGVALLVALIMLLLITLIGLAAARTQTLEARMTANMASRDMAMQQAEATLRYAETAIQNGTYIPPNNFIAGAPGLFNVSAPFSSPPQYECISGWANYAGTTACGATTSTAIPYTGDPLPLGGGTAPQFIIELLPQNGCAGGSVSLSSPQQCYEFRITANATGTDGVASVRLQSIYRYIGN